MSNSDSVQEIAHCLLQGGIVLLPTDTVYGLAVWPLCAESVARLYRLKDRPTTMHLPIMAASVDQLESLGLEIPLTAKRLLASHWIPGPLTLVLGFANQPMVSWLEGRIEVAIRIPNDKRMLSILESTGPLYVTSANRHGAQTQAAIPDILAQLNGTPDRIVDGGTLNSVPSTLVNCRMNPPVIERVGIVPRSEIEKWLMPFSPSPSPLKGEGNGGERMKD